MNKKEKSMRRNDNTLQLKVSEVSRMSKVSGLGRLACTTTQVPAKGGQVRSTTLETAKEVRSTIIYDKTRHKTAKPASCKFLITQSLSHLITSQKAAFTLAEILITLAVIGIVAALTIPNLVQSYKKKIVETRLAKFYSVMNQAIQLSEIDNGPKEYWDELDGVATEGSVNQLIWFEKYFKPYLKYNYVTTDKIFDTTSTIIVYFSDGSLCKMSSGSFQFWPNASDYSLPVYDEENDSYRNPRESSGIKYFTFHFWPYEKYKDDVNWKYHYKKKGISGDGTGGYRTDESVPTDRPSICKRTRPHPYQYCRGCRPSATEYAL